MSKAKGKFFRVGKFTLLFVFCCFLTAMPVSAGLDQWTSIGPEGGVIEAIAIDPSAPDTIYAGTPGGGVFKSINGGGSWSAVNTGLNKQNLDVHSLAIDPSTPDTIYVGPNGVYKSTNGGESWSSVDIGRTTYYLAIDESAPDTIYAGTNEGVRKSINGGGSWSDTGLTSTIVTSLAIDPSTPETIYSGTFGGGVFKSTNGGGSWSAVNIGGLAYAYVESIVIDRSTPDTIYAGTHGGVFKSINGGASWNTVNTGLTSMYVYSLAIDPSAIGTIYAGTIQGGGVFRSINGGGSWSAFSKGLNSYDVRSLAIDPFKPDTIYAGTDGGVQVYTNTTAVLTVSSINPAGGVAITVTPNDNSGNGNGSTPFTRTYAIGGIVTLTAPATAEGNNFVNWTGCNSTNGTRCTVTMTANKNVTVKFADKTPPTGGTVTPTNTAFGAFVSTPFDLSTNFTDNESDVTFCKYTKNGSTWLAGTVSGTMPNFTCTQKGITGTNGQVLTLNMRATSAGGTGTAIAVMRTVDASPPVSGTVFTAKPGSGRCTLNWNAASDSGSGMNLTEPYKVRYQAGTAPGSCTGGSQAYIGTALNTSHVGLMAGTTYYYRLCYKDNVGNQSQFSGNPVTCIPDIPEAGPLKLPDSDQRKCYQAVSPYSAIPCAGTGQDGAYIINPLSYTDNDNGTVTDNNTYLIWQQQDDGITKSWANAKTYCDNLSLGGYSDWRLPSKKELVTIVNYAIPEPGPTIQPVFNNARSSAYWTATDMADSTSSAWNVVFYNGQTDAPTKSANYYARCVRGEQQPQKLVDMGNGTVTDLRTGLLWQQKEANAMKWGDALSYCEGLSLAGLTGWRLPNIKELESVIDDSKLIDLTLFPDAHFANYWSSTNYASDNEEAWPLFFGGSGLTGYRGKESNYNFVRCVHEEMPPGPGPVTATPSYGSYVGSPFVLKTVFIHNGGDITSCEYTIDGKNWNPATISATSPIFLCTKTDIIGTNGQTLVLNMRATSGGGTETAKAITRKVDIAPPVTGLVFTATPGKGQCTIAWDVASDSGSGMNETEAYEVRYQTGADPGSCTGGNPAYVGAGLKTVHKGLLSSRTYYYRLCYKDNIGNMSEFSGNPVICVPTANASGPFNLPDAGQTTCYNETGGVVACPAPDQPLAQDGSYHMPLSYTDNGHGTVTDNNTGLMWQQQGYGNRYNWYEAAGTYHKTYNPSSLNICGGLVLGGYSDWRLPSKLEMMSLVDYGIPNPGPKIDTGYFLNAKQSYLTVTSFAGDPDKAWSVSFGNGGVGLISKIDRNFVLCVRGAQLDFGNFTDNHDGTVTDNKNGLMWQQGEPGRLTWTQAISYCEGLNLGGNSDWRLPNFKEIQSLSDDYSAYPAINKTYFPDAHCDAPWISAYWSSTTYDSYKDGAYVVDFYDGSYFGGGKWGNPYARCVRGGPDPFIKAPSNLTANAVSSSEIDLGWKDNSSNETGFKIERKTGACASANTWLQFATKGANVKTHTNTGLTANTTYSYRIKAYNTAGYSAYSNCASAKTGIDGSPNAPTNLSATSMSASQIKLTWTDNSTDETGFKIYRKKGAEPWVLLTTTAAGAVSYSDAGADYNTTTTTYSYYVKACKNDPCSPNTSTAVVPYKPTTLTASAVSSSSINLTWTDKSSNEIGFQVYKKSGDCSSPSAWSMIATKGANSTSHSNTGLSPGTTYSYKVRAYYKSPGSPYAYGYSSYSNCSDATTP